MKITKITKCTRVPVRLLVHLTIYFRVCNTCNTCKYFPFNKLLGYRQTNSTAGDHPVDGHDSCIPKEEEEE